MTYICRDDLFVVDLFAIDYWFSCKGGQPAGLTRKLHSSAEIYHTHKQVYFNSQTPSPMILD